MPSKTKSTQKNSTVVDSPTSPKSEEMDMSILDDNDSDGMDPPQQQPPMPQQQQEGTAPCQRRCGTPMPPAEETHKEANSSSATSNDKNQALTNGHASQVSQSSRNEGKFKYEFTNF